MIYRHIISFLNHDYTEADEEDEKNTLKSSASVESCFKNGNEQPFHLFYTIFMPSL